MRTLLLNDSSWDLVLERGNLVIGSGVDAVVQKIKARLQFFSGEWFLDRSLGIPFFTRILVKAPNFGDVRGLFYQVIKETEGVDEINTFVTTFNPSTRLYRIQFTVTINGAVVSDGTEV